MKRFIRQGLFIIVTVLVVSACTDSELKEFFGGDGSVDGDTSTFTSLESEVADLIQDERECDDDLSANAELRQAAFDETSEMLVRGSAVDVIIDLEDRIEETEYTTDYEDAEEIRVGGFETAEGLVQHLTDDDKFSDIVLECDYVDIGVGHETTANYWNIILVEPVE